MASRGGIRRMRFGAFEVDLDGREVRKQGIKIRLQDQPFRILALLLARPGEIVTREEVSQTLWPNGTFVNLDRSLGTALGKLRQALGDSGDNPRFIETLPRQGYRLIVPVATVPSDTVHVPAATFEEIPVKSKPRLKWIIGTLAALIVVAGTAWLALRRPGGDRAVHPRSILVLPLENLSGDPQQDYFADGMTDALITELARIGSLRVISRTSAMSLKGTHKPLAQVARELNVNEVLEGTVVRSGDRVRITAQLVEAAAERHLWAETYERQWSDVLSVQAEIAQAIAGQVHTSLISGGSGTPARRPPADSRVNEALLKGRYHLDKGTETEIRKAIQEFQGAIDLDPGFAPAYAGLADSYVAFTDFYRPSAETMPQARAAAQRALELDERLAEAHTSLGVVRFLYDWDWKGAEVEFRRAIGLNPNYADAHIWYANFLAQMARHREAAGEINVAENLDPLSVNVWVNAAWVFYLARRNDQLAEALKHAADLDPDMPVTHGSAWFGYVPKAAATPAIAYLERGTTPKAASPLILATLAAIDAAEGRRSEARRILAHLAEISTREYVCYYELAAVHAALGEKEDSLRCLGRAYDQRSICLPDLYADPRFDPLRGDPRFQDLLRRISLPP
jgi:TolB-like protein/DNA-binding winged helix-turn-helix (wHTH) protein/Tfp pilus assembly protein PilF